MARGVTTEWEDIQVKMGNWKAVEKEPTAEDIYIDTVTMNELYDPKLIMSEKQLEEMAEDDLDFDEDEFMKEYRAKRIGQLKAEASKPKFGSVYEINKQDWDYHVQNAPKDTRVVICFYQN